MGVCEVSSADVGIHCPPAQAPAKEAAAPATPAVSPGNLGTPSVCSVCFVVEDWSDLNRAVEEESSTIRARYEAGRDLSSGRAGGWPGLDDRPDPKAMAESERKIAELQKAEQKAEQNLLRAIADSRFSADDIRNHFAADSHSGPLVDRILRRTALEDLKAARSLNSASQTGSAPRHWRALEQAVDKALAKARIRDKALGDFWSARDWRDGHSDPQAKAALTRADAALTKAYAEETNAKNALADAILASPFSANEIKGHFPNNTPQKAAVEKALSSAFDGSSAWVMKKTTD